jgi:murein hydrolase activator
MAAGYSLRRILPLAALLAGGLAVSAAPAPASAQSTRDEGLPAETGVAQELEARRRRVGQTQQKRAELRREMQGIESRVHDISEQLELAEREIDNSRRMLAELEFQIERQQAQIASTANDLATTRGRLEEQKRLLNRRLREIYKRGPLRTVQVLLGAESFSDLLNRYKYMQMIARYDRQLLGRVGALESRLIARERILSRSLGELQEAQEARAAEHAALETLEGRHRRSLASAQQARRTTASRLARLEEDAKSLTALISTLEARRREAARRAAGAETATLSRGDAGTLAWPVEGRLIYPFGRQTQPNGTTLRWNGIGIAATEGTSVRAVEAGTVVLAGPFEGYGPTVVVSHGGGYYSLYLYLREVAVDEGEAIQRGKVIGSVGGERTPEGPHIEFQIRSPGGEAVDPLTWLRRRSPV